MTDQSWILNPKAIRQAKECIRLVKEITGVRVKLSDPDFVQQLHSYTESTKSAELGEAYARLISMAGVGFVMKNLKPQSTPPMKQAVGDNSSTEIGDPNETIEYSGRIYPKYRAGRTFKGLYRGQPRYA